MKYFFILIALFYYSIHVSSQSSIERIKKDVYILASDSFLGRKPYTKGDTLATNYILQEFVKHQVELFNTTGKQEFAFPYKKNILHSSLVINNISYQFKRDFIPSVFSQSGIFEGEAIFTGYGLFIKKNDSIIINHFNNAEIKDKWVIMFSDKPQNLKISKTHYSIYTKISNARRFGAKGIIFVSSNNVLPEQDYENLVEFYLPIIFITKQTFEEICKNDNLDANQLEQLANKKNILDAIPFSSIIKANIYIKIEYGFSNNIIGFTQGSDPKLKNEYIVVGAHFDHLGVKINQYNSSLNTEVYNGADDNASGVSGMLELMRIIQQQSQKTKRSIIWIAFAAEEIGLLGSKYFVENPPVTLNQIVAMINLDMIGRLKDSLPHLTISGTGTSKIFNHLLKKSATNHFKIIKNPNGEGPSDHAVFYRKKIPVLFLNSGLHEDYHKTTDDAEKINFHGMANIIDFTYNLLINIANYPKKISFSNTKYSSSSEIRHKELKVTLGIIPDVTGSTNGLLVEGVKADGIAEKSGIKKGDIILEINGKNIKNIYDYMNIINELENEKNAKIKIKRNDEIKIINAKIN